MLGFEIESFAILFVEQSVFRVGFEGVRKRCPLVRLRSENVTMEMF